MAAWVKRRTWAKNSARSSEDKRSLMTTGKKEATVCTMPVDSAAASTRFMLEGLRGADTAESPHESLMLRPTCGRKVETVERGLRAEI